MRHWLLRVMAVLSLGGGFTGLVYAVTAAFNGGPLELQLTILFGFLVYGFGIWTGMRMLEGNLSAARLNLIYWWLQVPFVNTSALGFSFYSGASARVSASLSWDSSGSDNMNFSANAVIGSSLDWSYMQVGVPFELGVNVLALICAIWGGKLIRRQSSTTSLDVW